MADRSETKPTRWIAIGTTQAYHHRIRREAGAVIPSLSGIAEPLSFRQADIFEKTGV
ncbi:MAG: hypothetical protein KDA96_23670 [Planctomycetaceae bacterium]|nr:hypothetical protein [Planctomycetaceae bacterium]